jgi:hypothetical protein
MFHGKEEHGKQEPGFLLRSWLKSWRRASPAVRRRQNGRERLLVEPLEGRLLLSNFLVTRMRTTVMT